MPCQCALNLPIVQDSEILISKHQFLKRSFAVLFLLFLALHNGLSLLGYPIFIACFSFLLDLHQQCLILQSIINETFYSLKIIFFNLGVYNLQKEGGNREPSENRQNYLKIVIKMQGRGNNNPSRLNCKLHYFGRDGYSIFLYYNYSHLLNKKDKFSLGYIRVFTDTSLFQNQLISTAHLNPDLEWGQGFFDGLIEGFGSFQVVARGDQDDRTLDLLVNRERDKIKENLLKVPLTEDYGKDLQKEFWKEFGAYNQSKNQQIKAQQETNQALTQRKQRELQKLQEFQYNCQTQKEILLGRLSALLREKVAKLREDFGDDFNITSLEDRLREAQGEQQPRIMTTYQQQRQFMGSLFQPSQDFYR